MNFTDVHTVRSGRVDVSEFSTLMQNGQISSVRLNEIDDRYTLEIEVVCREKGFVWLTLAKVGHLSFSDRDNAIEALLEALAPNKPEPLMLHLVDQRGQLLCSDRPMRPNDNFTILTEDEFNESAKKTNSLNCRRCAIAQFAIQSKQNKKR